MRHIIPRIQTGSRGLLSGLLFSTRMGVSSVSCPRNSPSIMICCFSSDEWLFFEKDPHCHFHSSSEIERPQSVTSMRHHAAKHDVLIVSANHLLRKIELTGICFIPEGHTHCRGPPPSTTLLGTRAAVQTLSNTAHFPGRWHSHYYGIQTEPAASLLLLCSINVASTSGFIVTSSSCPALL